MTWHCLILPAVLKVMLEKENSRAIDPEYQQSSPPGEVTPAGT